MSEVSRITIKTPGGNKTLSIPEYKAMSAIDRTNLILEDKVQFFDADGKQIQTLAAIKSLSG